jgi:hypothetical protein
MTKLYERFGFRSVETKDGTVTMRAELPVTLASA